MRKILQFALPISFFFLGFLILNYFVFYGLSSIFHVPRTDLFYIILLITALLYPFSLLLERLVSNFLTRAIYAISAVWFGITIYIMIMLVLYAISIVIADYFIQLQSSVGEMIVTAGGVALIAVALAVSGYAIINATRLEVKEVDICLNGLKNDIRAVQLTDVHLGPLRNLGFIKRMVDITNDLTPDIVFITGDLFDGTSKLNKDISKALNRLKAPILFVTGNHDVYQGLDEIFKILSTTEVKILRNEAFHFKDLQILGVDHSLEKGYLEKTLKKIEFDRKKPTILMYHLPQEFKAAKQAGINLQLSGHTHDGQFFPFQYLVKLKFPCIKGLYDYQGAKLYVSQGTGTWGPPMRLGSRCEITLIELKSN